MHHGVKLSVVCLGTGRGASMVYDGCCSASYVFCADGHPLILFGAGYGVTRQCLRYFGVIPSNIFLFSSRSHISAELPVILAVESRKGRRLCILAEEAVMSSLKLQRLTELRSKIDFGAAEEKIGGEDTWALVALQSLATRAPANHSLMYRLNDDSSVAIAAFRVPATGASCGAVVLHHGVPVVGLTGDCAYDAGRYQDILRMAPVMILDGRRKGSPDHASFSDIAEAVTSYGATPPRVFVGQYGLPWEAPPVVQGSVVSPIVEGAVVTLGERLSLSDRVGGRPSTARHPRSTNGTEDLGRRPRKILIINNELPDAPPTPLMVQRFRTIAQVQQRISELLRIRPVGALFCAETGRKVEDFTEFVHGMRVVATRVGGRPIDVQLGKKGGKQRGTLSQTTRQGMIIEEAAVSVDFDEYMRRAHLALQRYPSNKGPSPPCLDSVNEEPVAVVDSFSLVDAELSPETPTKAHADSTQHNVSSMSAPRRSLKFTTLQV